MQGFLFWTGHHKCQISSAWRASKSYFLFASSPTPGILHIFDARTECVSKRKKNLYRYIRISGSMIRFSYFCTAEEDLLNESVADMNGSKFHDGLRIVTYRTIDTCRCRAWEWILQSGDTWLKCTHFSQTSHSAKLYASSRLQSVTTMKVRWLATFKRPEKDTGDRWHLKAKLIATAEGVSQ